MQSVSLTNFASASFTAETTPPDKPKPVETRILIVCEGEKTEKLYFDAFRGNQIGQYIVNVECEGTAKNTIQVVKRALALKRKAQKNGEPFDNVWAVFDLDDFPPKKFNHAISYGERNGVRCAWSNQSFELWYVLHFTPIDSFLPRMMHAPYINHYLRKYIPGYSYRKSDPNMLEYLTMYGNEAMATELALKSVMHFSLNLHPFHLRNPSTTVYRLVKLLRGHDWKFNQKVKQRIWLEAHKDDKTDFDEPILQAFKREP